MRTTTLTHARDGVTVDAGPLTLRHLLECAAVDAGARIALVDAHGAETSYAAFVGTACVAAAAPLNPASTPAEFDRALAELAPRLLLVDSRACPAAALSARRAGVEVLAAGDAWLDAAPSPRRVEAAALTPAPDDVALVLQTSGTTARPKCVPLTHRNLLASAAGVAGGPRSRVTR